MQCSHQGATNLEPVRVLFLKYADPSQSELVKQEHQVGSPKDWNYKTPITTPITDTLKLEENKLVHKKNKIWKNRLLRETKIWNIHAWGKMKRAQEPRVDEFSFKKYKRKSRHNAETDFSVPGMQEQMNSNNDSVGFEEESNHSGRLSHFPSQLLMIPSSSYMLGRDKRLPLDKWNALGLQENVFGNQFSTFGSRRKSFSRNSLSESVPRAKRTRSSFGRDDEQIKGTIPMPTFERRPSTMSSLIPVEILQNTMVGEAKTANIGSASRQILHTINILTLQDTIKKPSDYLFWFST